MSIETVLGLMVALVLNAEFKGRAHRARRDPDPLGDPDHRLGQDVGAGCFNDQFGMVNDMLMSLGLIDAEDRLDRQRRDRRCGRC